MMTTMKLVKVIQLLSKYESDISNLPGGDCYYECFNAKTGKPNEDFVKLVDEAIEELNVLSIPFE